MYTSILTDTHIKKTHTHSLGFWIVFGPYPLKLVEVMRSQDGPITRQIVKVVHDDGHEQVNDLK